MELSDETKLFLALGSVIIAILGGGLLFSQFEVENAEQSEAMESIEIDKAQTLSVTLDGKSDIVSPGTRITIVDEDRKKMYDAELAPHERTVETPIELGDYTLILSEGETQETVEFTVTPRVVP